MTLVQIVGHSGSGKTTLLNIMERQCSKQGSTLQFTEDPSVQADGVIYCSFTPSASVNDAFLKQLSGTQNKLPICAVVITTWPEDDPTSIFERIASITKLMDLHDIDQRTPICSFSVLGASNEEPSDIESLKNLVDSIQGNPRLQKLPETNWEAKVAEVPVAMASPEAAALAPATEQTVFTVVLADAGANKLAVVKVVREITGFGLTEAKALVEGAPKTVKEGLSKEDAEVAKQKLLDAGAQVKVQ